MHRVMVIGMCIYSMVCDIKEYQGESDGICFYRDSEGRWYMVVIVSIVRVYVIENGGYGLGMSDGMLWWYMKNSEGILYVIYGRYIVWN